MKTTVNNFILLIFLIFGILSCGDKKLYKIIYADGSNNSYVIIIGEKNELVYNPLTREMSSSGAYNGGKPAKTLIGDENIERILKSVFEAVKNKNAHIKNRIMTSGQIKIFYENKETKTYILNPKSSEKKGLENILKEIMGK